MKAVDGSGLRKRQRGFAAVPNETVFRTDLSARAFGVLVKVIALPEGWDLRSEWLVAQFTEGREAIMTAIRELRRLGFYRVERRRTDAGTFTTGVSISDVAVPEWAALHAAACSAQGTDRPRWDVSLRVLADGSLEDEPARPAPVDNSADYPADDPGLGTVSAGQITDDRKRVSGDRSEGSTAPQKPGDRSARRQETDTEPDTSTHLGRGSHVSRGSAATAPSLDAPLPAVAEPAAAPRLALVPDPAEGMTEGAVVAAAVVVVPSGSLSPPSPRCPVHLLELNPPPCGGCKAAREAHEAWAIAERGRVVAAEAEARARDRRLHDLAVAEAAACRLCDSEGTAWVGTGSGRVSIACKHDGAANRAAVEAKAAARDELARVLSRRRPAAGAPETPPPPGGRL